MTWKALGRSESKRSSSTARGATRTSRTDSPIFTGSRRRSACNRQRGGHHRQADYTRRTLRERPLRAVRAVADVPSPQRALIWALGLGAFGLAFSITTTAAYLPPLLQEFTRSSSVIGGVLVGGGFLFHAWEPSPFVVAALVTILACGGAVALVREDGGHGRVFKGVRNYLATSWSIVRGEPELRRFLIANTAWEGSFAAARTFVVLYVVIGLDQSTTVSAQVLAT